MSRLDPGTAILLLPCQTSGFSAHYSILLNSLEKSIWRYESSLIQDGVYVHLVLLYMQCPPRSDTLPCAPTLDFDSPYVQAVSR